MRSSFLLVALTGVMLFSCKKNVSDSVPASIEGTWQMIVVKDNASNTLMTKPSSIQGEVVIHFVSTNMTKGSFTGKTPTNDIAANDYLLGPNQTLSISILSMTKVAETDWGTRFVNNIRDAQKYEFETGQKLIIMTINNTLTFKKL